MKEQNKSMKSLYPTAFVLYLSFFVHGFGAAILSQNTKSFQALWNTDAAGVLYVISALGIGRLITYPFSGAISDKFGRRLTVIIGCLVYIGFFGGILLAPNTTVAFFVAILAGVANGFLDSGVLPAVMEILVQSSGLASILSKLCIAIAQYILPVMVTFWASNGLWFGWTFVICIVLLAIISLLLTKLPFATVGEAKAETAADVVQVKSNFWIEGVALIIMGYTATATFQVFLNINKDYGMTFLNMTEAAAGKIGSNYALGSIFAVLLNVVLVKWIKPVRMIVVYPALSLATLLWMYFVPSPIVAQIGGFLIGATCAGGVLQFLVSVMSDLFPASKAKAVSMIMIAGALCAFSITAIAGTVTSKFGVQYTLLVSAVLAVVSIIASIVVNIRYNMLMNK
ncbi:MFS transporter [Clostridium sp. 29_15]|uniref:MFS transporter n=1 Tax=Clostridium sp. 29_15 TaxID=1896982 RepID=UPI000966047E|nr:MFS transporter [Clostridium sp. 29_15]OKZ87787.1 MAG: MFS transporter [Clostridium sp. 29_15]